MKKTSKTTRAGAAHGGDTEAAAEWLAPNKLKVWADNPRAIGEDDVQRVARSISAFGFGAPIVARLADLQIIAGHVRHAAALSLGLKRVPVRLLNITADQAHALAVADNRYVELVSWKPELVGVMESFDADMRELTGWAEAELTRFRDHFAKTGTSEELDPDDIATTTFTHTCPQCGCQFN